MRVSFEAVVHQGARRRHRDSWHRRPPRRCARACRAAYVAGLVLLLSAAGAPPAFAQLKGHYIPGFTGLDNGTQPPPGVSVAFFGYAYPTDTIKDASGDTILNGKLGVRFGNGERWDIYTGYGRALTGDVFYKDIFRLELRLLF